MRPGSTGEVQRYADVGNHKAQEGNTLTGDDITGDFNEAPNPVLNPAGRQLAQSS
ncbi:hypothetical protein BG653_04747 [Streptomyces platensis]|uniref:Uncharacterized protein n=1 Tax=Streptomyces platensis TaxID=58346 RepID=A0ABX3XTV8_STRPT|nr:hypothetical protein BG653_04747 [Streptomyces platensis]